MAAAASLPAVEPLLEMRGVDAAYGPFRAIFDVSLTLVPGRVLALLGSNGAGKTTIARVCSGRRKARSASTESTSRAGRRIAMRSSASSTHPRAVRCSRR